MSTLPSYVIKQIKNSTLARVSNYTIKDKRKLLMNSYIMSKFNHFPLLWICLSRDLNIKINRVHKHHLQ